MKGSLGTRRQPIIVAVACAALALCLENDAASSDELDPGAIGPGDGVWRSIPGDDSLRPSGAPRAVAELDAGALHRVFDHAARTGTAELTLPLPDSKFAPLRIEPAPADARRSPHVERYHGKGVDDRLLEARVEWTSRGLHAVVHSAEGIVFIDPAPSGGDPYVSYFAAHAGRPLLDAADLPLVAVRQIEVLMAEKSRRTAAQRKVSSRLLDALRIAGGQEVAPGVRLEPPVLESDARQQGVPESRRVAVSDALEVGVPGEPGFPDGVESGVSGPAAALFVGGPDDRVLVDIRAEVTEAVLARIGELGGEVMNSVPRYRSIRAMLPLEAVETLAELDAVIWIAPASPAVTNRAGLSRGLVRVATAAANNKVNTSEGDAAHDVIRARSEYGVDGTGVGIGALSNGIATLAERQATGDLPAAVMVLAGQQGSGDEGTAMLEIVHDLAPGAHLYSATALGGEANFAANIEALCAAGADVIVDDVFYFVEPAFQDGIVAQGVNRATEAGCFHFSSAGNAGNLSDGTAGVWEGDFAPVESTELLDVVGITGVAHTFAEGEITNRVEATGLAYLLKWADPLETSGNDYDLYALDDTLTRVVRRSANTQSGTQDPVEWFSGLSEGARLLIVRAAGESRYLRLNTLRGRLEYATAGQTSGHSAAANAVGVAAVDARTARGEGGVFDGRESVETFSSDGPRRIFYEPDGTPITPGDFSAEGGRLLAKPDVAAADNVSTSTPGFSSFRGTSAAAPHAAAIAALMVEAAGGRNRTNLAAIRDGLYQAALDIEEPGTDRDAGAGIPLAPSAVAALASKEDHHAPAGDNLADQTLGIDDAAVAIDLATVFEDADGDPLDFVITAGRKGIVSLVLDGSVMTIDPQAPGVVTLAIRVTDPGGLSVVRTITVVVEREYGETDYDTDDDGLIEISYLEQLDAMRFDLDGDGVMEVPGDWTRYFAAFTDAERNMGCPKDCSGYELTRGLDFDDPASYASGAVDRGWSRGEEGEGWEPVGDPPDTGRGIYDQAYSGTFRGNGHNISHLYVHRPDRDGVGLFGGLGVLYVSDIGLIDVDIVGRNAVGSLAGSAIPQHIFLPLTFTTISRTFATGRVRGVADVGGLFGLTLTPIGFSWAGVEVSGVANVGGLVGNMDTPWGLPILGCFATGVVKGEENVGGLAGQNGGKIIASYATGAVVGRVSVGGLVGLARSGSIFGSYATGRVSGLQRTGGLVGVRNDRVVLRSNFWDWDTTTRRVGVGSDDRDDSAFIDADETASRGARGLSTLELQAGEIVESLDEVWHLRWRSLLPVSSYWHFGHGEQYSALKADFDGDGSATWQEFGYQIRQGPELDVTGVRSRVILSWTAVAVHHWSPAPRVTYTVYRDGKPLQSGLADAKFTDTLPANGNPASHTYQVAAVALGGEVSRSRAVTVRNRPPPPPAVADQAARTGSAFRYAFAAVDDPDGDAVTYSASGLPAWLTLSAADRTFRGTPDDGDAGTTVITLIAADDGTPPLRSTASFKLTVNAGGEANRPPEAVRTLGPLTVSVGAHVTTDLGQAFRDPDGDGLGFAARTGDVAVARAWVERDSLVVLGVRSGTATVTVTASDGALTAMHRIGTTVVNAPPVAVDSLAARTLPVPGDPLTVDVRPLFEDPDGDVLTFAASSSDEAIVTTDVVGSSLTAVARSPGEVTVDVFATDEDGSNSTATLAMRITVRRDYDADADGLIDIADLEQFNAVRFDLDGNGRPDRSRETYSPSRHAVAVYETAFPDAMAHMGCDGLNGCLGYELLADLDLDTNGNGMADEGDLFWNGGSGWTPFSRDDPSLVGGDGYHFGATFEGNGFSIANLFINWPGQLHVGLFGRLGSREPTGEIRNLRLVDMDVTGGCHVGGLVGDNYGVIERSHVRGTVAALAQEDSECGRARFEGRRVGGLVGGNTWGRIEKSSAVGIVSGFSFVGGLTGNNSSSSIVRDTYASSMVSAQRFVGGLIGRNRGTLRRSFAASAVEGAAVVGGLVGLNAVEAEIVATYAAGAVRGDTAGGLVGRNSGAIEQSYSTGRVNGSSPVGGLVGQNNDSGTLAAAVWDSTTSGRQIGVGSDDLNGDGVPDGDPTRGAVGKPTTELQAGDIYFGSDDRGKENRSDAWDFGSASQYPALIADIDGDGKATWQEFGYQLREGPALSATVKGPAAKLQWSPVVTGHWRPPPDVSYTVVRDSRPAASGLTEHRHTDPAPGLDYQVAAVVAGGAATLSSIVVVADHCYAGSALTTGDRCRISPTSVALDIRKDGTACVDGDICAEDRLDVEIGRDGYLIRLVLVRDGERWKIQEISPKPPNRAPETVSRPVLLELVAADHPARVELSDLFRDPDGDELTYGATSSHPATAAVAIAGSVLSVVPLAQGTATITVTARDSGGLAAVQFLDVAVAAADEYPDRPWLRGWRLILAMPERDDDS